MESSPLGGWLVEAALFQILYQRRVYELRDVGPAELRPSINPISPFRTAFNSQSSGAQILPGRFGLGLRHRPRLRIRSLERCSTPRSARRCQNYGFTEDR